MSRASEKRVEREDAIASLRNILKPGDRVLCVLRSVSASGMSRAIDFYTMRNGDLTYLSGYMAQALDLRHAKRQGLVVSGCGMDMGFATVYSLGRVLFPDGFAVAGRGRNGDMSGWDNDGGYALHSDWL